MPAPLFIRILEAEERSALEQGLRSPNGFTVRRCHMFLSSAEGQTTAAIAKTLCCNHQTVRNAISDFHQRGLKALSPKFSRLHTTRTVFNASSLKQLQALLQQSPAAAS